ncbi:hypothetical protein QUB60_06355 [Microcoleus sp. A2-C5]|uniref:EF-hand domain-containing protein n=1 Tax=unclassified Microcoleus TaxID=2642155 RepID=UPI002FD2D851
MALTELQKRKFKVAFDTQDIDGSGVLTPEDFEGYISQLKRIDSKNTSAISLYEEMGEDLKSKADIDSSGGVTLDEWYNYIEELINDPARFNKYIIDPAVTLLKSVGSSGENYITMDEYKKLSKALNIERSDAETAFNKLDKSGDGRLDITELKEAVREYYFTEDENSSANWLFGSF